jgi:hypothetical protein
MCTANPLATAFAWADAPGSTINEIAESASKPAVENRIDFRLSGGSWNRERLCPGG